MAIGVLAVNPGRCKGCHICELYCSLKHFKVMNPARARVHVVRREPYVDEPVICIQCGLCISTCPVGAIKRDAKTMAVIIDEDKCIGCERCVPVCPYGVITIDPVTKKALKCNLCWGDPECAKHCPDKALVYVSPEKAAYSRRIATALSTGQKKLYEQVKRIKG